ncbi:MAG: ATP-binding protein [Pyrinomonadaceae bacterium]
MAIERNQKILSRLSSEEFFGRESQLRELVSIAQDTGQTACVRISHGPGFGVTEFLKQASDRSFSEYAPNGSTYFAIRREDRTAARCAARFLYQVLLQTAAIQHRDPRLIGYSPDIAELTRLVSSREKPLVERLAQLLRSADIQNGDERLVESIFSSAFRTAKALSAFVLIDDTNEAEFLIGGETLALALRNAASAESASFAFAELRRSHLKIGATALIDLKELRHDDALRMLEGTASRFRLSTNESCKDLVVEQCGRRPARIEALLRTAMERRTSLSSFRDVERVYVDEVIGGRMARRFDRVMDDATSKPQVRKHILAVLHDMQQAEFDALPADNWEKRSLLSEDAAGTLLHLTVREFLSVSGSRISADQHDTALADYVDARYRLEVAGGNRALVVGDALDASLKRAPDLLGAFYRRNTSIGLRELLFAFEVSDVPSVLFDHAEFRSRFGGVPDAQILQQLGANEEIVHVPQIFQAVHTESLYKPIAALCDPDRCVVGRGFDTKRYDDEGAIAWIAVEIDSKLEATKDVTAFWCDRLEMVALICGFQRHKIWLIASEGFTPEAMEHLKSRNALGSNRRQTNFLRKFIAGRDVTATAQSSEYEIVVPMGEDTELIAAHAVEEIAKRHHLDAKSINQIKTALVEACINAAEHAHSPDGKIYQKFTFDEKKLTINISNRGLRLTDRMPNAAEPTEGRRGWGLALMRRLMDEVTIDDVEDGTSISMIKYLPDPA